MSDTTDTDASTLAGHIANAFGILAGTKVTATPAGGTSGVITFADGNINDGGFTLTFNSAGAVNGTGASLFDSSNGANFYHSSDIITDFAHGVDHIDLNLVAGSATNTTVASGVSSYATALASADANFAASSGAIQYYFGWIVAETGGENTVETGLNGTTAGQINAGDKVGLLFVDNNKDGTADEVIRLVGIDGTKFDFHDIVA